MSRRGALSKIILRNLSPSLYPFISTLNVPIFSDTDGVCDFFVPELI